MKKPIIFITMLFTLLFSSCSSDDKAVDEILDNVTRGAILRTLNINSSSFNFFDTNSEFSVTLEEQDVKNGDLLASVDVFITFKDNKDDGIDNSTSEILLTTLPASAFSPGDNGLPVVTFSTTLTEALSAVGLESGEYFGGDRFVFRFGLNLTDGTTYSAANASGTISGGSFFRSPYQYNVGVKCIPVTPVTGVYTLDMEDSYGDGWDGAFITVTIDGESTEYTIDDGSEDTFDIVVPDGTTSLVFTYTAGNFESEHSYKLYAPNGNLAASGGPGPARGEIILNICPD